MLRKVAGRVGVIGVMGLILSLMLIACSDETAVSTGGSPAPATTAATETTAISTTSTSAAVTSTTVASSTTLSASTTGPASTTLALNISPVATTRTATTAAASLTPVIATTAAAARTTPAATSTTAAPATTVATSPTPTELAYTSTTYSYSLTRPSDWSVVAGQSLPNVNTRVDIFLAPGTAERKNNVQIYALDTPANAKLTDYTKDVLFGVNPPYSDLKTLPARKIGGADALGFSGSNQKISPPYQTTQYFVVKDNKLWLFVFTNFLPASDKDGQTFGKMLDSFKFS